VAEGDEEDALEIGLYPVIYKQRVEAKEETEGETEVVSTPPSYEGKKLTNELVQALRRRTNVELSGR
jgi:hypothetical protein